MSAFLCTDVHLCALAQFAVQEGVIIPERHEELARLLKWSNLKSLHVRYGDRHPDSPARLDMDVTTAEAPIRDTAAFKMFRCWNYQASEWEGYDEQDEYEIVWLAITAMLVRHGFDPADSEATYRWSSHEPWGVTSWEQIIGEIEQPAV